MFEPFWFSFICPKQLQQLDDVIKIPKETIDILKNQVFGFDTFFVTSQDPYEVCAYLSSISFFHMHNCLVAWRMSSVFSARVECCSKETCGGKLLKVMRRYQRDCKYVIFLFHFVSLFVSHSMFAITPELDICKKNCCRINLEMNTGFSF
jgi:hypothetical protein